MNERLLLMRVGSLDDEVFADSRDTVTSSVSSASVPIVEAPHGLRTLFDAQYGSVWRLLRRLGVNYAQLDDAAQEVFWIAARRLQDIEPGREKSFLYGVGLRVASQVVRQQRVHPTLALDHAQQVVDETPSPEAQLQQRQARALLDVVLGEMTDELRAIFVLFELEGMPVTQIAALYEIPHGTASSRLRRAREEFSAVVKRKRAALTTQERGHG